MMEWILLLALISVKTSFTNCFTISPEDVVQAEGLYATFHCQYLMARTVGWIINGTSIYTFHPPNVSATVHGESINELSILAEPSYNNTEVWCVASLRDEMNNIHIEHSSKGELIIQGVLGAVDNFVVNSNVSTIYLMWGPPYSLNLTQSEPDIVYCVDIYDVTAGMTKQQLHSNCNVLELQYRISSPSPNPEDRFQFVVIPKSNVVGAINGTPSTSLIASYQVDPAYCAESIQVNINFSTLQLKIVFPNWKVTLTTYIRAVDAPTQPMCMCTYTDTVTATINCLKCTLHRYRMYSVKTQCENALGISNSSNMELSTHKILKGNLVSAVFPGGVNVSCNFMVTGDEKMFTGCLAVVVSTNDTEQPTYKIIHFDNDNDGQTYYTRTVGFTITSQGLKTGDYRLFVFETLGNLFLPVRFPAVTEAFHLSSSSPSTGQGSVVESSIVKSVHTVVRTDKVIISGVLYENSQGITLIHHQCIGTNDSLALSTSYSSFYPAENNKDLIYAIANINFNSSCYNIAVFGVTKDYKSEETPAKVVHIRANDRAISSLGSTCTSVANSKVVIFASLLAVCGLLLAVTFLLLICNSVVKSRKRDIPSKDNTIELKRCKAYEAVFCETLNRCRT